MPIYRVCFADFYRGVDPAAGLADSLSGNANIAACKPTITQLIARYSLAGKQILSLGAGRAFEEYWMACHDCRLVMVDLDLDPLARIEDHLKGLPQSGASSPDVLTYAINDAIHYCENMPQARFDALYVSSLHPDEMRREAIQQTFITERTEVSRQAYVTWPKGVRPYSPFISAAWPLVINGGLAIMQHYRGGVDITYNPHYFDDMRDQFAEYGMTLLEAWCFRRSPAHLLVVAVKGGQKEARGWAERLRTRPPITSFHGRYPDESIKNDVIQAYSINGSSASNPAQQVGLLQRIVHRLRLTRISRKPPQQKSKS